jgi:hypothetical protein
MQGDMDYWQILIDRRIVRPSQERRCRGCLACTVKYVPQLTEERNPLTLTLRRWSEKMFKYAVESNEAD